MKIPFLQIHDYIQDKIGAYVRIDKPVISLIDLGIPLISITKIRI